MMNILQGIKKLGTTLLILSFGSFAASPIASLLGVQQPPIQNTVETIKYFIIIGGLIMAIAVLTIFVFGYLSLSGWKGYRNIPKGMRVLFAFTLGIIIISLSGVISILLPVPFLPTILTTILLWGLLRAVSSNIPSNEAKQVQVTEAIIAAKNLVEQVEPTANELDILDSHSDGKNWKVSLFSEESSKKYEVEVDINNGGIKKWKLS